MFFIWQTEHFKKVEPHFSTLAPEVRSQELGKKKSSGTQGNTIHEFEGTQLRVSVNKSDGLTGESGWNRAQSFTVLMPRY